MKTFKAETLVKNLVAALQARIDNAPNENQKTTLQVELNAFSLPSALAALDSLQGLEFDVQALSKRIAVSEQKDADFIAVYALQKVRKAIFALALKSTASLDKYSFSIVKNLASLQSLDNLNTQRTICSKIELDEMQVSASVKVYHNCSPSTASTQASSTRMMLQALNICNATKRSKGDSISFTDSKTSEAMQALFA